MSYLLNPTPFNSMWMGISEGLSSWTNPELLVAGASMGIAGWRVKGRSQPIRQVGKYFESVDDVMANPGLLEGQAYGNVRNMLGKSEGWVNSVMTRTRGADKGWVLRQVNSRGQETGKLIQYHPGTSRHYEGKPYWKVSNGTSIYRYPIAY